MLTVKSQVQASVTCSHSAGADMKPKGDCQWEGIRIGISGKIQGRKDGYDHDHGVKQENTTSKLSVLYKKYMLRKREPQCICTKRNNWEKKDISYDSNQIMFQQRQNYGDS